MRIKGPKAQDVDVAYYDLQKVTDAVLHELDSNDRAQRHCYKLQNATHGEGSLRRSERWRMHEDEPNAKTLRPDWKMISTRIVAMRYEKSHPEACAPDDTHGSMVIEQHDWSDCTFLSCLNRSN